MRRKAFRTSIWVAFAVLSLSLYILRPAQGAQITGIVSFGDSLTDVGNYYAASGKLSPPTAYGYAAGEFTNGMNWVQYLARDLGVAAPTASVNGGTDYAFGGAMTGTGFTSSTFTTATPSGPGTITETVPNIGQQIASYLGSNTPTAGQLYTIWGGGNDVLIGHQTDPTVLLNNIGSDITTLAMAGARQFLVGNLPPLNLTPAGLAQSPADQAALAQFSYYFNLGLQSEVKTLASDLGVQIRILDVNSLFNNATANPSKYGFTDVTDQAISSNPSGQGYLFWDIIHPTTQADEFIGNLAAQTVPEPSSLVIFATALLAVAGWGRRRRIQASRSRTAV
jgi:phospholipase/lecithinase/hemolysin